MSPLIERFSNAFQAAKKAWNDPISAIEQAKPIEPAAKSQTNSY